MPFEILEHPADIGFRALAPTLSELFAESAMALLTISGDPQAAEPRETYHIELESNDRDSLMVDWLNEVLYWFDGKGVAFHEIQVARCTSTGIHAIAKGEKRNPERHRARLIVKAATWHQLRIEQRGEAWCAEVYLDI